MNKREFSIQEVMRSISPELPYATQCRIADNYSVKSHLISYKSTAKDEMYVFNKWDPKGW